jgi:phenylpropionate dioxygenase-like ring-hydroxylating dioxygenase large terminal subunit
VTQAALGEPVRVASVREQAPLAESHQQAPTGEQYDWKRQWYPLAVVADLDPGRPTALTLLGQPLCIWRDGEGEWRALEDRCSHRLAPLTEGRVEADGTLLCSYHGWRFNGEGQCTSIPQAADGAAEATACASSRSCVQSYPVQIQQGMLWVWGDKGPTAFIDAAAKTPAVTRELEALPADAKVFRIGKPYVRDVHYDFATLVENFLDPAHVPFAHHGVQGNRYKPTEGYPKIRPSPETDLPLDGGFSFDVDLKTFGPVTTTKVQFQPPCIVRYFTPRDNGAFSLMNLQCVPTGPGRARVTYSLLSTVDSKFTRLGSKVPAFQDHLTRHLVLDGDHALLHIQERVVEQEAAEPGGSWRKSYYMPTESDRIVTAWRRWLDRHGGPSWASGAVQPPAQPLPKTVLLDRYEQHTKYCPTCQKALFRFRMVRAAAAVLSFAAAAASLAAAVTRPMPAQWPLPAGLAVTALAFAWRKASDYVEKFHYVQYDHQSKE